MSNLKKNNTMNFMWALFEIEMLNKRPSKKKIKSI